jgi:hypothetical protein
VILTASELEGALTHEEDIDTGLFGLDLETQFVDVAEQTRIAWEENVLSPGVEGLQLDEDLIRGLLRPSDKVDTWFGGLMRKFL